MFLTHTLYGSPLNDVSRLFAPVVDLPEPQLIHAEHAPRVPVLGIERDALLREISRRPCTTARRAASSAERRVELGVLRVQRERALAQRVESRLVVRQELDRRRDRRARARRPDSPSARDRCPAAPPRSPRGSSSISACSVRAST